MKLATTMWRRVRDSNPRSLSTYSISSAAPSTTRTTLRLCDSVQFKKLFARTDGKNNKIFSFRTFPKRSVYGRNKRSILPNLSGISSPCRYDLFGTTPYFVLLYNSSIPGRICQFSFVQNRRIFLHLAAEFWRRAGRQRRGAVAPGARVW